MIAVLILIHQNLCILAAQFISSLCTAQSAVFPGRLHQNLQRIMLQIIEIYNILIPLHLLISAGKFFSQL